MFMPLEKRLKARLQVCEHWLHRRERLAITALENEWIHLEGKRLFNFASNDYLGLAQSPKLKKILLEGLNQYGLGARASQLVAGYTQSQKEFEEMLADFLGFERVVFLNSGYAANFSLLTTLLEANDHVYIDKKAHASFYDAILSGSSKIFRYPHLQIAVLEKHIQKNMDVSHAGFIISDGLFSMEGDIAPLPKLLALSKKYGAELIIDDAHGIGVLGKFGQGVVEQTANREFILTGTLSKAFGSFGGFAAGKKEVIEVLIQQARGLRYTSNLPAVMFLAGKMALQMMHQETWRREKLHQLICFFQKTAKEFALPVLPSETPIQGIMIPDVKKLLWIGKNLKEEGFLVGVIRSPSVPPKQGRLRITLSALHQEKTIYHLLVQIKKLYEGKPS